MKFEALKRLVVKPILSTTMVQWVLQWERQKRFSHWKCKETKGEKCHFNIILFVLFLLFMVKCFPRVGHSQKFIKPCEKECRVFFYSFVRKFIQFFDIMKDLFNYKVVCIKK